MKLVGLTVVTYKDNFGSALQTYATQKVIRQLGYDTKIFDISGLSKSIKNRKIRYFLTRIFFKAERTYLMSNFISSKKKKSADDSFAKNMKIRHAMYVDFNSNHLSFFPYVKKWKELTEQASQCDMVLVGSDQLWGSANIAGKYFTLEFVPQNIKKIAYSTSFGVSVLPKQIHRHARKFLKRIEFIGVREETGKDLVKSLTGRDVPVVCDPTMLLSAEEWMEIQQERSIVDGPYILTYFMGDNPIQRDFVKKIKEKTGYKIVGLLHGSTFIKNDENYCDETPYNVGPCEFLNLIRNAKYVCTDSFHCSVFSIIYCTEFFVFPRDAEGSSFSANDRIHTLLNWTGLKERMLQGSEDVDEALNMHLNNKAIDKALNQNRKESLDYLMSALKE